MNSNSPNCNSNGRKICQSMSNFFTIEILIKTRGIQLKVKHKENDLKPKNSRCSETEILNGRCEFIY